MKSCKKNNEQGAVLLTTLLVMSVIAALAVAMMDDIRFAIKRASNIESNAQAEWYLKAADDFSVAYLQQQLKNASGAQLNGFLVKAQETTFPLDGGIMRFRIMDGSHCLSLNGLTREPERRAFRRLLENLGWASYEAAQLTSAVVDWQDADSQVLSGGAEDYTYLGLTPPYRTPNTAFTSPQELRAIQGMTEERYQALRPFICAGGQGRPSEVNINTLSPQQAPLLGALLGDNMQDVALRLITERPSSGFAELAVLKTMSQLKENELKEALFDNIITEPKYIWIEADVYYQEAHRTIGAEFLIDNKQVKRTYRRYGEEGRRPVVVEAEE